MKLNVAILGASGIGKFHAREFKRAGCNVVAILGSSKQSSDKTSKDLSASFGINARPYFELNKLLENERLDMVSICTPWELHEGQIKTCLEHNVNVLCEKPFVSGSENKNYEIAQKLVKLAKDKHKVLSVNTQWPSALAYFGKYTDLKKVKHLEVHMESGNKGLLLLKDLLPHANSMLVRLIPKGSPSSIRFTCRNEDKQAVTFDYKNKESGCSVEYVFILNEGRPKNVIFCINDKKFVREVGEDYSQKFRCGNDVFDIEDPFKVSVCRFVESVRGNGEPLISEQELLENVRLQDLMIKEYSK